ncbi:MAG: hypothetical protein GX682_00870 [Clostridiaceae bacterium]|nr:hypothetical protein [Clostridiaceae bacterium]
MLENIIFLNVLIILIFLLYYIFDINIKDIIKAAKNQKLDNIVNKFPENKEICQTILKMLNNKSTKIKEEKESKTSLYVVISNKIYIGNIKESYTRIQTIAHECLHSIQNRKVLLFNFIYSNLYLLYFIVSLIIIGFGIIKNTNILIYVFLVMSFIYYVIRSFLEMDAMIKAKYVAKEYMENYIKENKVCEIKEVNEVINKYEEINIIGIPASNYILILNCIIKTIVLIMLNLICNFII